VYLLGTTLKDYRHHIVHTLRELGYWSALIGEQHISKSPDVIGYDEVFKIPTNHTDDVVPVTLDLLERTRDRPFFLFVGSNYACLPLTSPTPRDAPGHALFAEKTYHVAYEPERCARTHRWKYIRRFGEEHLTPVLANIDDGPSKDVVLSNGWAQRPLPAEQLYDLLYDPVPAPEGAELNGPNQPSPTDPTTTV
jgi:arylsulfatase A-like enzyme